MLVFRAGIHKSLVRIANREDPDLTAYSEAVRSGSALFVQAFLAGNYVRNFRTFTVCNQKLIFLFLIHNICYGYSKEPMSTQNI